MAGKAAKHKDELAAKRDQFKNEVVTWGLCVEYIKWMREDSHREIEDVFAACLEEYRSRCTSKEEEEEVAAVEEQLNKLALELESMD